MTTRRVRKMDSSRDLMERVIRAEEQIVAHAERDVNNHHEVMQAVRDLQTSMEATENKHHERLLALEKEYERYRGAWGLLTIIGTALLAAWSIISEVVRRKFGIAE